MATLPLSMRRTMALSLTITTEGADGLRDGGDRPSDDVPQGLAVHRPALGRDAFGTFRVDVHRMGRLLQIRTQFGR